MQSATVQRIDRQPGIPSPLRLDASDRRTRQRRIGAALWVAQVLLAALFLFAGGFKLLAPAAAFAGKTTLPIAFLRFVGAVEITGALGLILPGAFRVRTGLTPVAAGGLVIIMMGATGATVATAPFLMGAFPFVVGIVAGLVAYGRARIPLSNRRGR